MRNTVLIIDDDDNDILLAQLTIRRIDPELRVEAALNGEAGLAYLRDGGELPALVLLDLKMPGISGFETLCSIRADTRLAHVPVVVLTSSDLPADWEQAYAAGAVKVLHKSVGDQFRRDLKSVLDLLPQ